jgi:CubicO group peptidase (beta-lactamase class C family)
MASGKLWGVASIPMPGANDSIQEKLDAFTGDYMKVMNAPGMTQALTDTTATIRTAGYGFANIDLRAPVSTEQLFQIGSITKSFAALILLQLRDEEKFDLHRPVLEYLPWLPVNTPYGPITAHHLLTHSSGLPDASSIFQSDPAVRHVQGFVPGAHFHYCNLGFAILGQIIEKLDGRPWYQCLQARILTPLGMKETAPVITIESSARSAIGYQPYFDDQVYPRQGRVAPRPPEVFDNPAGSIASTPGDMSIYLRMLLNGGQGIVSADGFRLLSTPYIKATEFSPTAFYGYGIAVDVLDGHRILRHTGGMNCFASSIHADLDGGVAAFASINAMQGYRPTPITQYAVQLLRAQREAKPLPAAAALADAMEVPRNTRACFAVLMAGNWSSRRRARSSCSWTAPGRLFSNAERGTHFSPLCRVHFQTIAWLSGEGSRRLRPRWWSKSATALIGTPTRGTWEIIRSRFPPLTLRLPAATAATAARTSGFLCAKGGFGLGTRR